MGSDGGERAGLMAERRHCCCFRADFSLSPSFCSLSVSVSFSLRPKPKRSVYEVVRCKQPEKYLRLINLLVIWGPTHMAWHCAPLEALESPVPHGFHSAPAL